MLVHKNEPVYKYFEIVVIDWKTLIQSIKKKTDKSRLNLVNRLKVYWFVVYILNFTQFLLMDSTKCLPSGYTSERSVILMT